MPLSPMLKPTLLPTLNLVPLLLLLLACTHKTAATGAEATPAVSVP